MCEDVRLRCVRYVRRGGRVCEGWVVVRVVCAWRVGTCVGGRAVFWGMGVRGFGESVSSVYMCWVGCVGGRVCWRCDVYREVGMCVLQVSLCDPESTLKKHFPIYGLYEIVPNSLEKLCQD